MNGVFCYRNLNRKGVVWSVKSRRTGRVLARLPYVMIENAILSVSPRGRARVLREKRKNVHAGVIGTWMRGAIPVSGDTSPSSLWVRLKYDPYKYDSFVRADNKQPINKAVYVILNQNGAFGFGVS